MVTCTAEPHRRIIHRRIYTAEFVRRVQAQLLKSNRQQFVAQFVAHVYALVEALFTCVLSYVSILIVLANIANMQSAHACAVQTALQAPLIR